MATHWIEYELFWKRSMYIDSIESIHYYQLSLSEINSIFFAFNLYSNRPVARISQKCHKKAIVRMTLAVFLCRKIPWVHSPVLIFLLVFFIFPPLALFLFRSPIPLQSAMHDRYLCVVSLFLQTTDQLIAVACAHPFKCSLCVCALASTASHVVSHTQTHTLTHTPASANTRTHAGIVKLRL